MPSCLAPCIIPQIEQGVASEAVGEKVTHGDQIYVNCTDNYEVINCNFSKFKVICR